MNNKRQQQDDDDGRVIFNMDVEGMRWHDKRARNERAQLEATAAPRSTPASQLSKSEARRFTWYAVLAGLLVATVFSVTWVLLILFLIHVIFK